MKLLKDFLLHLYEYREYLKQSVARDLTRRYKRSVLGYCWSMLHPLMMIVILSLVFSHIMRFGVKDYAVFLFTGMLPWIFFSHTCEGGLGIIRANANIIDQVNVPKYLFLLSLAFSNLLNFIFTLVPLILVMLVLGHTLYSTIFLLPLLLIPLFFLTVGIALILSVSNVFFEDTHYLTNLMIQALYFLSPVLYGREMLPHKVQAWLLLNPVFPLVEMSREILYYGRVPDPMLYVFALALSTLVLFAGLWVTEKADDKFIYFV